jgi:Flp pilus assembly protein TadD
MQVERAPNNAAMQQLLGELFLAQRQGKQAEASLSRALALDPNRPQPYFHLGIYYEQQGNYARAREHYERALILAPRFAHAANNLAWLYAEHGGDLKKALVLVQVAREQMPKEANVLDTLGWIYYKQNNFLQAVRVLEECVQNHSQHAACHYHLGMAYYRAQKFAAARTALTTSLALDPTQAERQILQQTLAALPNNTSER